MSISRVSAILGYIFLIAGVLGFIPYVTVNGYLLGIFHVNPLHNIVHLITGVILLWAGYRSECASLRSSQVFGVIYGLVTILGLVFYRQFMLGGLAINIPITLLHLVLSVILLYYGFFSGVRYSVVCGVTATR